MIDNRDNNDLGGNVQQQDLNDLRKMRRNKKEIVPEKK